jgi:hypothetical protein
MILTSGHAISRRPAGSNHLMRDLLPKDHARVYHHVVLGIKFIGSGPSRRHIGVSGRKTGLFNFFRSVGKHDTDPANTGAIVLVKSMKLEC